MYSVGGEGRENQRRKNGLRKKLMVKGRRGERTGRIPGTSRPLDWVAGITCLWVGRVPDASRPAISEL